MLKRNMYKEAKEELEKVKNLRKKFEEQIKEVEEIKKILIRMGESLNSIVGVIDTSQAEMSVHKKIILETVEKVEKLERKDKPSDDVMYK